MAKKTVNLDELVESKLSAVLNGKEVPVRPLDGVGYQLALKLKEPGAKVEMIYEIGARLLPSLTKDEVMSLTPVQIGAVIALAQNTVEDVEAIAAPPSAPAGRKRGDRKNSKG